MKKEYELLLNNKVSYCSIKELFQHNPKLLILNNLGKELYCCNNIQSLYLYPLSIIDYINNLSKKEIISLNIIEIDERIDYEKVFNRDEFKYLKSVEILIKDSYDDNKFNKIYEIIEYLSKRNILISLNIKNLNKLEDSIITYLHHITYFKVFLNNKITLEDYTKFLKKLSLIRNNSSKEALLHIKTYLDLKQISSYENMMKDFIKIGVDVFQVSKELIPLDTNNISVDIQFQNTIRKMEKKYSSYKQCKFISVKDITTLYYPRFELDERNSRICYASKMKPYLHLDSILPCKVNKVLNDISNWKLDYSNINKLNSVLKRCGTSCDDCASIFENDLLYDVEKTITDNKCHIILKEQ